MNLLCLKPVFLYFFSVNTENFFFSNREEVLFLYFLNEYVQEKGVKKGRMKCKKKEFRNKGNKIGR